MVPQAFRKEQVLLLWYIAMAVFLQVSSCIHTNTNVPQSNIVNVLLKRKLKRKHKQYDKNCTNASLILFYPLTHTKVKNKKI